MKQILHKSSYMKRTSCGLIGAAVFMVLLFVQNSDRLSNYWKAYSSCLAAKGKNITRDNIVYVFLKLRRGMTVVFL